MRREGAIVLAALIRSLDGHFDLAEDALQEAYAMALEVWPSRGIPDQPGAWLTTVARRKAIDAVRRRRESPLDPRTIARHEGLDLEALLIDPPSIEDDRLRLIFTCCHPALSESARIALALRTLGGLSTREIARAFLEPEPTTAQRIVRAKNKIQEARIPYEVPGRDKLPERLQGVLGVVYLIYNESYAATDDASLIRVDLASEAIRLARLVHELLPREAEAQGLLALLLLTDARRQARLSAGGEMIPLEDQDRAQWDSAKIAEGQRHLQAALRHQTPGPYQIQAAIASLHAQAKRAQETDWPQITALYGSLLRHIPSPVVELNAAVAMAMATDLDTGLAWIARLKQRGVLANYHLLPAAEADLLRRAGRLTEAQTAYREALRLVKNPVERRYLERRCQQVERVPLYFRDDPEPS